ncbi:MAG: hypothetical protein ACRED0_07965 [Gammaproteobacteria bacterium]
MPEPLLAIVAKDQSAIGDEVKQAAVLDWVRMRRIAWRKGAELLGMPLRDFMGLMIRPAASTRMGSIGLASFDVAIAGVQYFLDPPPVRNISRKILAKPTFSDEKVDFIFRAYCQVLCAYSAAYLNSVAETEKQLQELDKKTFKSVISP